MDNFSTVACNNCSRSKRHKIDKDLIDLLSHVGMYFIEQSVDGELLLCVADELQQRALKRYQQHSVCFLCFIFILALIYYNCMFCSYSIPLAIIS